MTEFKKPARIRMGGLWRYDNNDGTITLKGSLGGIQVAIRANGYKRESNQPDYILYFEEKAPKEVRPTSSGAPTVMAEEEIPF